jgi:hypothetical protein
MLVYIPSIFVACSKMDREEKREVVAEARDVGTAVAAAGARGGGGEPPGLSTIGLH